MLERSDSQCEKILFLPPSSTSSKKVTAILREHKIVPRNTGIRHTVEFSSGAALLTVEKDHLENLLAKAKECGIEPKRKIIPNTFEFKLHGVPDDYPKEELAEDINDALGHKPSDIIFIKYKDNRVGQHMAIIKCSRELLDAANNRQTIRVEYQRCRIDTKPQLMKCKKCSLYGHTQNHCKGITERIDQISKETGECLDCLVYNQEQLSAGLPRHRLRDTNHAKGHHHCATKKALLKKYYVGIRGPNPETENG